MPVEKGPRGASAPLGTRGTAWSPETRLYTDGVAEASDGTPLALPPHSDHLRVPGTPLLDRRWPLTGAAPAGPEAVAARRAALAGAGIPGQGTRWCDMARTALIDIRALLFPNGAMVAAASPHWRYVWPRDASYCAVALALCGLRADAVRVLAYLERVLPRTGPWQARYLPDGSGGVPDDRGVQLDGAGWVLWAAWVIARLGTGPAPSGPSSPFPPSSAAWAAGEAAWPPAGDAPNASFGGRDALPPAPDTGADSVHPGPPPGGPGAEPLHPVLDGAALALPAAEDRAAVERLVPRALAVIEQALDPRTRLPRPSPDYWEKRTGELTLGTAAPLALGARSAAALTGDVAAAGLAEDLEAGVEAHFAPHDYPRTVPRAPAGQAEGRPGKDASVAFLMPPFAPARPGPHAAWLRALDALRVSNGGLRPGEDWPDSTTAWTPQVSLFAMTAACLGEHAAAHRLLDWLAARRTRLGALPEKVTAAGRPAAVAPLALTGASVLAALAALEGRAPPVPPLPPR
ncbi:glycoside hydrolase family 15 protein [Nocardiopsis halophila]|uniref:glycoside hydrolase family 15 protein n=1 Tax=Nocardiopsis halophila TaxID=141692 RepID=UPI000378DBD5|nr:glycoside hydrolase family 15 protein [Nocardiopsis halophila]